MVTINDARITFIYGECFTGHLGEEGDECEELLWEEWDYDWAFGQIRGGHALEGYAFPWRDSQKSAFWRHYMGDAPGSVTAGDAWAKFVPLRLLYELPDISTTKGERLIIDVFGFPFGIMAALTVHVAKGASMPLPDWQARLRALHDGMEFLDGTQPKTLEQVFALLLDEARDLFYLKAEAGTRSGEPLSINTVMQAQGGTPGISIDAGLQRDIHAVTAWPADAANALLASASFLPVRGKNAVPGDVHYAAGRGITVWRPGLFARRTQADGPRRRHTLSCLSHNLVAGSVQAEMLRLFAIRLAGVNNMASRIDVATVRKLARLIDALRRGNNTFRSSAIGHLLEDPSSKVAVNELLAMAQAPPIP